MNVFLLATGGGSAALVTFLVYMLAVFGLAALSNRLLAKKNFLSEYFLGSRGLGMWAFALTFAATAASGGSFTGFPSKIYTHGWILALWIGSYMVVPLCGLGFMGKRINQVARIARAITVPDVIRARFRSPAFALLSVLLIVFFISVNLVAQFKSGALILKTLLADVSLFTDSAKALGTATAGWSFLGDDPQYLVCLLVFGIAVVAYTTYGGFHAVVWTDVMQGIVMVLGVLLMVPLTLWAVGGLPHATEVVSQQIPPALGKGTVEFHGEQSPRVIPQGTWLVTDKPEVEVYRVSKRVTFSGDERIAVDVELLRIRDQGDADRAVGPKDGKWTSYPLMPNLPPVDMDRVGKDILVSVDVQDFETDAGPERPGMYVTGPGPSPSSDAGFLPLSLAISFFFMWAISGSGQPHYWVRLMAFDNATTLRRSILMVACYYTMIYLPLVVIFVCARVLMPGMEAESDRIMPAMAVFITDNAGVAWLAGLLVAAPFAAVMSTVDSVLLVVSSAIVRDVYQQNLSPDASERTIKRLTYLCTFVVGTGAMLGAVNPPRFLQDIIVYTGSGLASCFLAPMIFALYWPRVNKYGAMAGMLAGFATHLAMYVVGIWVNGSFFDAWQPWNLDPVLIGLGTSFATVPVVSLLTPRPPVDLVRRFFCRPVEG